MIDFKKEYKGKILPAHNLELVREIVCNYSGISSLEGRYLVLDGIGFLSETGNTALLKFLEESKIPIILLSYYDKVLPTITSRVKFVFKKPINTVLGFGSCSLEDLFDRLRDKEQDFNFKEQDRLKFVYENCPNAYILLRTGSYDYADKRINSIIAKCR